MTGRGLVAVVLRCATCGQELPGLDGDRAWTCGSCRAAYEVEGDALAPRPFRRWRVDGVDAGDRPVLWLPFWRIEHIAEVTSDDARALDAARDAAAAGRTWVRAFWIDNAFLLGDPGQALTAADHAERIEQDALPPCVGTRVSSAEALRLAELFALARADRVADVSPVTLRLVPREIALVAVPFLDAGRELVCAVDTRSFRKSAIPDYEAIAAVCGARNHPSA